MSATVSKTKNKSLLLSFSCLVSVLLGLCADAGCTQDGFLCNLGKTSNLSASVRYIVTWADTATNTQAAQGHGR